MKQGITSMSGILMGPPPFNAVLGFAKATTRMTRKQYAIEISRLRSINTTAAFNTGDFTAKLESTIRNSLQNNPKGGTPVIASTPSVNNAARIGLLLPNPAISVRLLVPIRKVTTPARRNKVALRRAWFQI